MINYSLRMIAVICAFLVSTPLLSQEAFKIGETYDVDISVNRMYRTLNQRNLNAGTKALVFEQEFSSEDAGYVKLYFQNFDLAPGDYVKITGVNSNESVVYGGKGKIIDEDYNTISDFWSQVIFDENVVLELYSDGNTVNYNGFEITQVAYGYSMARIDEIMSNERAMGTNSICSSDNKERIACYNGTEMFNKARAVCRLIINGASSCTGWLLGSDGHIMTNNHCIGSSSAARNTDFVFNYQNSSCSGSAVASSDVVASSSTFIRTSSSLDYTLVRLPVNPTSTYGYLQLSPEVASVGDRIYIPQHAGGRRKEISVNTDNGVSSVNCVGRCGTSGAPSKSINYFADTEGGSSGSPVIDYNSHFVLAIHNTGQCPNGSYGRSDQMISSIGSEMPTNGVGGDGGGDPIDPDPVDPDCPSIDFSSVSINSFSNQDANGSNTVSSDGSSLTLRNNTWKYIPFNYQVTSNTVIEFEFSSTSQGEIHAVGFENDNTLTSSRYFKVHGTQNYGITNYDNYAGGTETYVIPVGSSYTGNMNRLVFINDNDVGSGNNSVFSNVKVYEGSCGESTIFTESYVERIDKLGIEDEAVLGSIDIVPNFVSKGTPLKLTGSVDEEKGATYTIINMSGQIIDQGNLSNDLSVDTDLLNAGIYLLKVENEFTEVNKRFVIK